MRADEMRFIMDLMPFAVAIVSIVMFFLYLTLRMLFGSGRRAEKKQKKNNKPETMDDRLDDVVRRATDLQHRIRNLEDIVYQDQRSK